jgi:ribonuclease E
MSHNKMLIDATHPEETRVVVLRNGRVVEFDYESAARRLLRGSIFLAKVTRVEPSLQAAFVDYGGNRHGFLAFNEIHPDYYQIPHSDRQALLEEEEAENRLDADDDDDGETEPRADGAEDIDADDDPAEDVPERHDDADDSSSEPTAIRAETTTPENDDAAEALLSDPIDPEDVAIDVSHLLPPEPLPTASDAAPAAETPAERELEPNATEDGGDGPVADGVPNGDHKPPKSIAAKIADDDRVVSEIVFPESADNEAGPQDAPGDAPVSEIAGAAAASDDLAAEREPEQPGVADASMRPDDEANSGEGDTVLVDGGDADDSEEPDNDQVEDVGNADAMEEVPQRRRRRARSYKIQEVIKRRQIVLIQVVKEERGNKGAALTTYLSLAGRYTVLMPNTARGGGISRKITNLQDRKRLKAIAQELDVPEGMGLIIRTAGAARTKQEIKRDFEYLLRLWENVRDLTLQSTAPSLVYEEGDLIKRSIRDLYSKDIDQILVAGNEAHKEAKSFMRMLMPSHAKNVIKYEDPQPLFAKYGIEPQLNAMFSPFVQLRSGGYLVINQTEALVAVDVNSGKATKEFSIEETALKTNLEAAEELSRQLKLRDLAGLIVVDFIDMEEKRNNRSVERKLKECLRADRARIQVGRISHFGLLEMSRQRLRTGVLEGSTMQCPHCQGTGTIRSTESVALAVLRTLEDALMSGQPRSLQALTAPDVALYLLNNKRNFIQDMEARYGIVIHVQASEKQQGANFTIERLNVGSAIENIRRSQDVGAVSMETGYAQQDGAGEVAEATSEDGEERRSRRRRRRRRGDAGEEAGRDRPERSIQRAGEGEPVSDAASGRSDDEDADDDGDARPSGSRRPRRRGRRGGRRNREQRGDPALGVAAPGAPQPDFSSGEAITSGHGSTATAEAEDAPEAADDHAPAAEATAAIDDIVSPTANAIVAETDTIAEASGATADGEVDASVMAPAPAAETTRAKGEDEPESAPERSASDAAVPDEELAVVAVNGARAPDAAAAPEKSETQVATATPPSRRSPGASPVVSEPRIERVVVRPGDVTADADAGGETEQPTQKKGWWQRNFGG